MPDPPFTLCAGVYMYGGYGIFGKGASITRTFTDLPSHNQLIF
jgi:hypothetical protein